MHKVAGSFGALGDGAVLGNKPFFYGTCCTSNLLLLSYPL